MLAGESNAYREEFFTCTPERYQIPTRRNLQNNANRRASDYVRARRTLELLRRTVDDSFTDIDLVVLPTRRRVPRKIDAAIRRERTDRALNPELDNTGQFNAYGIPAISVRCGFTSAGLLVGDDCRTAFLGSPRVS